MIDGHPLLHEVDSSILARMLGTRCLAIAATFLASCHTMVEARADASAEPEGAGKLNIVVILADDLGFGDVKCYNPQRSKIATPHIDRLATQGMRFTDAHSSSGVCSPSRYTLLTGRYHWRTRLQAGIVGYLEKPLIDEHRATLATMLKQQGYHTACIGKWHLGWDWQVPKSEHKLFAPGRGKYPPATPKHRAAWKRYYSQPIGGGPTTRGFDEYFGTDVPNWPPYCFIDNDRTVGIPSEFLPKRLFDNHLASLSGPALADWDLAAILPTLAKRATQFIHRRAKSEQPFFLYFPLTSPHTPLAVATKWQRKSGLDSAVADLIMQTDDVVGQVMQAIHDAGIEDQTLVIFTSDNGFAPYVGARHLETQGHFPSGPLRGYKGDAWEGGHRVPFIVRWPKTVAPNSLNRQLVHQADLMATLAELLEIKLPATAAEDSFSLLATLRDPAVPARPHAISQGAHGMFALRQGSWKMIFGRGGGGSWSRMSAEPKSPLPAQLYDLANDLAEQKNVYDQYPARVSRMTALLESLVKQGRSTPGPAQKNDVRVNWRRHYLKPR